MKKIIFPKNKNIIVTIAVIGLLISFQVMAKVNGGSGGNSVNSPERNWSLGTGEKQRNNEENKIQKNGDAGVNFCQKISDLSGQAEEKFTKANGPEDRLNQWQEKISEQDGKLTKLREQWDSNRDDQFKKLEENATTDEQKKAVADFEAAVKDAISIRRAAVDGALSVWRSGVKDLISARKQAITSDASAFGDAVKAAFDKAESDCQSGVSPTTIRMTLKSSIQAARVKYHEDRQGAPKVGGVNIQTLITARRNAVSKAMIDFKAAMEKARSELKKAFPTE